MGLIVFPRFFLVGFLGSNPLVLFIIKQMEARTLEGLSCYEFVLLRVLSYWGAHTKRRDRAFFTAIAGVWISNAMPRSEFLLPRWITETCSQLWRYQSWILPLWTLPRIVSFLCRYAQAATSLMLGTGDVRKRLHLFRTVVCMCHHVNLFK